MKKSLGGADEMRTQRHHPRCPRRKNLTCPDGKKRCPQIQHKEASDVHMRAGELDKSRVAIIIRL